jgi:hypothetical protein
MNTNAQLFFEHLQERLSDAHSKHEYSIELLDNYIDFELDLPDDQKKKLDELLLKVYATLEEIKLEII